MLFHDAHCHISSKSFLKDFDLQTSFQNWEKEGLEYVIGVSTKTSESLRILELKEKYKTIIPGVGVHPWSAKKPLSSEKTEIFLQMAKEIRPLVIGEIGLDHHFIRKEELYPFQEETFEFFLKLAEKNKLPINVHLKGAEKRGMEILSSFNINQEKVIIHWYSGPESVLNQFIKEGYFFTINPSILAGSPHIKVLKKTPIKQILTESDGNVKYTINDNRVIGSPSIIPSIIKKISKIKEIPVKQLSKILSENLHRYLK
ncbi:MAG: TatD family hydrolase [Candidatus Heimdallarchaeaceae archaeon]